MAISDADQIRSDLDLMQEDPWLNLFSFLSEKLQAKSRSNVLKWLHQEDSANISVVWVTTRALLPPTLIFPLTSLLYFNRLQYHMN